MCTLSPTSSSWLNVIERWFRDLTQQRLKRGVYRSVKELNDAIDDFVEHHNKSPKGHQWHKSAAEILAKVKRAKPPWISACLNGTLY